MKIAELLRSRSTMFRASTWAIVGYAGGQLLRLANNLVLTRLVEPDAFGLMAIVTVVIIGIEMTTDLGLNTSIVQNRDGDQPDFVNTAWTIKIIRSAVMALLISAIASPLAGFYGEPELTRLLLVVAAITAFSGFSSNAIALASRRLWLGRATVVGLIGQVAAMLASAAWAFMWPSVWALIAGLAANAIVTTVLSHVIFPQFRNRLEWNTERAKQIFTFGKWIFLTSILIFAAGQIDRIILPKLVSLEEFGLYSIAYMWAQLPVSAAQTWCGRLIFPIASEELRSESPNKDRLLRQRRRVVVFSAVLIVLLYIGFDTVFHILYTPQYWPAIAFFKVLLIGAIIRIIDETYRVFNLAAGTPQYTTAGNLLAIVFFLAAVLPLYQHWGASGVALSYAAGQCGALIASFIGARRHGIDDGLTDLATVAAAITMMIGMAYMLSLFQ